MQLPPGAFVADGLQGARDRLGPQDALDRSGLKGLVAQRVFHRLVDIVTLVIFLHPQYVSGLEPTVAGMSFGEALQKHFGPLS